LIFKCLTDNIMLDDFKTELKRLGGALPFEAETVRQQSMASPFSLEKPQINRIEVEDAATSSERPMCRSLTDNAQENCKSWGAEV
jgi:hypothetical protein